MYSISMFCFFAPLGFAKELTCQRRFCKAMRFEDVVQKDLTVATFDMLIGHRKLPAFSEKKVAKALDGKLVEEW